MLEIRGKLTSGELFINDKYYAVGPTELGFLNLYTLEFILNPHKYNTIVDKSLLDNNVYYFVFMTSYSNSRISCWLIPNNIRVGTWYCIYKGSQLVKTAHSKNELDLDIYYLLYAPKIYYINLFMWNKISNNYETTYKYIKDVFDECDVLVNTLEETRKPIYYNNIKMKINKIIGHKYDNELFKLIKSKLFMFDFSYIRDIEHFINIYIPLNEYLNVSDKYYNWRETLYTRL